MEFEGRSLDLEDGMELGLSRRRNKRPVMMVESTALICIEEQGCAEAVKFGHQGPSR